MVHYTGHQPAFQVRIPFFFLTLQGSVAPKFSVFFVLRKDGLKEDHSLYGPKATDGGLY